MPLKPSVHLVAFACEPDRGSEPGAGWQFARALAVLASTGEVNATLLTRPHRVDAIKEALDASKLGESFDIVPIKVPLGLHRIRNLTGPRLAYLAWQFAAYRKLRNAHATAEGSGFVAHHVTFATAHIPTAVAMLGRKLPVVFGPAGTIGNVVNEGAAGAGKRWVGAASTRFNVTRVTLAVAQNDAVAQAWSGHRGGDVIIEPNPVVAEVDIDPLVDTSVDRGRIVSVGMLTPIKRHDLVIRAMTDRNLSGMHLRIIGEGPERERLGQLVRRLNISDRVELVGSVTHAEAMREISKAAVLVSASESESAGWVVAEAQTIGTPPVVRAGTGGETLVRLAGVGVVFERVGNEDAIASAVTRALAQERARSDRWAPERLPATMLSWYQSVLKGTRVN